MRDLLNTAVTSGVPSKTYERNTRNIRAPRPPKTLHHPRETPPAPAQFDKLAEIPLPTLDHPDEAQPRIDSYVIDRVAGHKLGPGRQRLHNFKYRMRVRGYGPE